MSQPDFSYGAATATRPARTLALFADRPHWRAQLAEEAEQAGFAVLHRGPLAELARGGAIPSARTLIVDCPSLGEEEAAALSRVDAAAGESGAQLIVSTGLSALDTVFACCRRGSPQILVDASAADRALALARVAALGASGRVREMDVTDRLTLLRLTEQMGEIAQRLAASDADGAPASSVASPASAFAGAPDVGSERLVRGVRPPWPDPRLVRRIIRSRGLRARHLGGALFADPAWDMLLDLTAARAEHARVSVSSLCIAAGVPPTTALRWIAQMTDAGLLTRVEDPADRRRAFIEMTDKASDAIARYFAEIASEPLPTL